MKSSFQQSSLVGFVTVLLFSLLVVTSSTNSDTNTPLLRQLRQEDGFPRPETRYVAWSQLDEERQTAATTLLGYDSITWNLPGSALVEDLSYSSLNETQRQGAITSMGLVATTTTTVEEIWDCWINHYDDYTWVELATEGVQQYFVALGWTDASWNGLAAAPATEDADWEELTDAEREAATEICYNVNLWNGVNLEALVVESSAPTTAVPTLSPTISIMPTGENSTRRPTSAPTTVSPTTSLPTSMPTATYATPPYPPLRYTVFTALPQAVQDTLLSDVLGYTEFSWNTPGTDSLEDLRWDQLSVAQVTALEAPTAAGGLAMTREVWDCYINHYTSFDSWDEMKASGTNVQQFWTALGWTEASWEGIVTDVPESEDKEWAELTATEMDAAMALCYMENTWNEESLLDYGTGAPNMTEEPTSSPVRASSPSAASAPLVMKAWGFWTGISTSAVILGFIGSIL